jgi:hypothetical protein
LKQKFPELHFVVAAAIGIEAVTAAATAVIFSTS